MNSIRLSALRGSTAFRSAALVLALAASSTAYAQDDVAGCNGLADPTERAACLDRVDPSGIARSGAAGATAATTGAQGGTITVTGSRLRRDNFNSPDPLQIISPELGERKGQTDAAELVQSSPLASGSTQITAALSSNFLVDGGFGAQTLSLRGLGPTRTLTLLNGRRAGPAGTRGGVSSFDLNVLPLSIIDDVEILKTGASSIYGSEAIAGVVNFKTRTDLDGFDVRAFGSPTQDGGGESYALSGAWGKVFDRGHVMIAADYYRRQALQTGDRDFLGCQQEFFYRPDFTTRADLVDPRTGQFNCTGTLTNVLQLIDLIPLTTGILAQFGIIGAPVASNVFSPAVAGSPNGFAIPFLQFNQPGMRLNEFLPPLRPATSPFQLSAPSTYFGVNYDGVSTALISQNPPEDALQTVIPLTNRYTGYLSGSYELTPNIELFVEGLFNRRENHIDGMRQIALFQYTGSSSLPFFDGASNALLSGDPLNNEIRGDVYLRPIIASDRFDFDTKVDYYRGLVGARGDFGGDGFLSTWNWDAYVQYSRSDGDYTSDVLFQDSLDTQELRTSLCTPGQVTAVRGVPCINIDFTSQRVLNGELTQQEEDFLFGKETGNTLYTQWTGEVFTSGSLFRLPGGDVQLGLGAQFRRDSIVDTPGIETQRGNVNNATVAGVTAGHSNTLEAFGELELPLLADLPFMQEFTITAAGRVTNVKSVRRSDGASDSDNGNFTYKIGANWQVNDWLRFRGTYGTSFRSPALFEQFLSDEIGFLAMNSIDPCINLDTRLAANAIPQRLYDNCRADGIAGNFPGGTGSAEIATGGGIGVLDPETSRAWTASVILTPPSLWEGFRANIAVDYFDILVKGQIAQLGAGNILAGCYSSEFFPDDPLCDLFTRVNNPASQEHNDITFVQDSYININRQHNRGLDVTAQLSQDLGNLGELQFLGQMTWTFEDEFGLFAGTVVDDNGEVGDPKWVGDFTVSWEKAPFTLLYNLSVVGGTNDEQDVIDDLGSLCTNSRFRNGQVCRDVKLEPKFYHTASITFDVEDDFEFTLGVANFTNEKPPTSTSVGTAAYGFTQIGNWPILGTYYDLLGRRFFASARARF